ncbi:MAG: hypothetical protein JWN15_289 [Firmicutes bacterium]|nr:hypothetical protein [Bacillota bacterium]
MAQEERLMILQMVADKKITASEAAELLKALDGGRPDDGVARVAAAGTTGPGPVAEPAAVTQPQPPGPGAVLPPPADAGPHRVTNFGGGLGSFIEDVVERVTSAVAGVVEPPHEFTSVFSGKFAASDIPLRIITGNGRVEVRTWDQPGYQALVLVKARGNTEAEARNRARDAFTVKANEQGFELEARRMEFGDLAVHVTLNVPIDRRYRVEARTGNGHVDLEGLSLSDGRIHTGNGRVTCRGGQSDDLTIRSGNGSVEVETDSANLKAETGNGSLDITPTGARPQSLRLSSGMGSVRISSRRMGPGAGFKVEAHTGMGGVSVGLPDLLYDRDSRTLANKHVIARTANFEQAAVPVTIVAHTGMGSVSVE